jgi:hypothetical protein
MLLLAALKRDEKAGNRQGRLKTPNQCSKHFRRHVTIIRREKGA